MICKVNVIERMYFKIFSCYIVGDINMKMECQLSGCQRHVYVEPGPKGRVHDYCGKTHAKQGGDLVDDKCCLNGGHPSPGHASDQASCHHVHLMKLPILF